MILHDLIQFENLMPRFSATVPPCWNEIQQEQQQRRHPQHLQQQGEAMQHTRTWRLQQDRYYSNFVWPFPMGHLKFECDIVAMAPSIQISLI